MSLCFLSFESINENNMLPELQELRAALIHNHLELYSKGWNFIPKWKNFLSRDSLKNILLTEYHSTPSGSHAGVSKTYSRFWQTLFGKASKRM